MVLFRNTATQRVVGITFSEYATNYWVLLRKTTYELKTGVKSRFVEMREDRQREERERKEQVRVACVLQLQLVLQCVVQQELQCVRPATRGT